MKTIIGVDPGVNGGMCVMDVGSQTDEIGTILALYSFSGRTVDQVVEAMKFEAKFHPGPVYLEKVHSMPTDGHVGAFTFGKVYGGLLFGFKCLGLQTYSPTPQLWMQRMECMTGGNKMVTLNKAKAMWPHILEGKTKAWGLSVADAMLIAEYGRRVENL